MGKLTFKHISQSGLNWWKSLSVDQKVNYKKRFEVYRNSEDCKKNHYPYMYDMRSIRLSQLGEKHIMRIWVFRDRI
jgi:hypothetical protein